MLNILSFQLKQNPPHKRRADVQKPFIDKDGSAYLAETLFADIRPHKNRKRRIIY